MYMSLVCVFESVEGAYAPADKNSTIIASEIIQLFCIPATSHYLGLLLYLKVFICFGLKGRKRA